MANEIATYLKYANLQMAAEALFGLQGANPDTIFFGALTGERTQLLTDGNNRASKFTATQAKEFASLWETIGVRLQLNHFSKDCKNAVLGTFTDKIIL